MESKMAVILRKGIADDVLWCMCQGILNLLDNKGVLIQEGEKRKDGYFHEVCYGE